MVEIPEELLRRSAEARAAATGQPVDEVLAEMRASISGTSTGESVESAPTDAEPEHPTTPPDGLLEREAEARAAVLGVSEAEAVAEEASRRRGTSAPNESSPDVHCHPARPRCLQCLALELGEAASCMRLGRLRSAGRKRCSQQRRVNRRKS